MRPSTPVRVSLVALAALVALTACDELGLPTGDTPLPSAVEVVDGDGVTQVVATDVDVAVRVLDSDDEPVEGVPVAWAVAAGDGALAETQVSSDADGVSRTTWTLGTAVGAQSVTATATGLSEATLTATATAGEVSQVAIVEGDPAFDALGDTAALNATATDEFGNEYGEASFTWASLDPSIVTVETDGRVASAANGTVAVTATLNGITDTLDVTVAQTLAGIDVELAADTAAVGHPVEIALRGFDPNGFEITDTARLDALPEPDMAVSDTSKAEQVDDWAAVVGRGLGPVTVTASVGAVSDSAAAFFAPAPEHAIAAGAGTNCALDIDGNAWCWGNGGSGELGNGSTDLSNTPVQVSGGHAFLQIAGNVHAFCGLTEAGTVYCWGWNGVGGIGIGATDVEAYATPQEVVVGGATPDFHTIAGDWYHFCAASSNAGLYCWGYNAYGAVGADPAGPDQCPGFGGVSCAASPNQVSTETFTDVAVGNAQSCALDGSGDAWCWGTNFDGQFGNGATSTVAQTMPVATATGLDLRSIDANWSHTCAIDAYGEAYCWGVNSAGRLGDGTTTDRLSPVLVSGGHGWRTISAGNGYTCGTTASNGAYCWGLNTGGKLGTGDWLAYETPTPLAASRGFGAISAGFSTVCALDQDGAPYCWGAEDFGALGNGEYPTDEVPVTVNGGHSFTAITARGSHSCGIDDSGSTWCWGSNGSGQLGNGGTDPEAEPVAVSGGHTFADVTSANAHTCALTTSGDAYCWGDNARGALGDGTTTTRGTPSAVSGGHTFSEISAGMFHTCALDAAGSAYCWGANYWGQLGAGTVTESSTPVEVSGGHTFVDIGAGQHHSCGLTDGEEIYCWGWDAPAMLGSTAVAPNESSSTPVLVDGGHAWSSMVVGNGNHTCAVTTTGDGYCWGINFGRIGDGTTNTAEIPVAVSGGHAWTSIIAMGDHTCGVTTGGTTYCWGDNLGGDLGLGGAGDPVLTPQQMSGTHAFTALSGSFGHTCAVTTSDAPYCWGYHNYGQIGNGEIGYSNSPQAVLASFTALGSTAAAIMAASTDGFVEGLFGGRDSGTLIPPAVADGSGAVSSSTTELQMQR